MAPRVAVFVAYLSICTQSLLAADPTPAELQKMVSKSVEQYSKAFESRDAKAVAAQFTNEAEYVDANGAVFHGRKVIQAELEASFSQGSQGTLRVEVTSIRPIAAGVVVEEGLSTFTPKDDGPAQRTRYSAMHTREQDGSWLIASIRELDSAEITPHERLKELSWLEGKWREEGGNSVVKTTWKWSDDGNFLMSEFIVVAGGAESMKGTHRVGWDAERQQFRSWIFDASGGYIEGWWTSAGGDSWSIQLSGVTPGGIRRSGIMTYTPDGKNAITVTQEKRIQAGINLPDVTHRIVRDVPELEKRVSR